MKLWSGLIWGPVTGSCEHGNEPFGFKTGNFFIINFSRRNLPYAVKSVE
jgi:hypothetical protein